MDQRAILAAVNNSAPVGAKGFWWNIADLSSILQLSTRDAEFLKGLAFGCWSSDGVRARKSCWTRDEVLSDAR